MGYTIGGIVAGIEQQIFRTTPPANELVAKAAPLRPVPAAGGGTITVGMPDDPAASGAGVPAADGLHPGRPGDTAVIEPVDR